MVILWEKGGVVANYMDEWLIIETNYLMSWPNLRDGVTGL